MTVIYQTTITRIGASATDALSDQMLITFREGHRPRPVRTRFASVSLLYW